MNAESETLSPELVINQLRKSGIVGSLQTVELQPLARNPGRIDHATRRAFHVWAGQKSVCYLLAGPNLAGIASRARKFGEACPDIAAKELFFESTPRMDFLGMEFIEGSPFEEAAVPAPMLEKAAAAILTRLEATLKPSSVAELRAELEDFFTWVLASPVFGAIDGGFLRDVVFPWVREGACRQPAQTRWTNGDFTAHNMIIDPLGRPWLIDYEYAHRTHFYLEDFVRWRTYSSAQKHFFDSSLKKIPPWLEAFFLLRQTVLDHHVASPQIALAGAGERVSRLRELAAKANVQFQNSFFLKPLTMQLEASVEERQKQIRDLDAEVVKRGEWGMALDQSLREAEARVLDQQRQIQDLDAEVVKRGKWGLVLDQSFREAEARVLDQQRQIQELDAEVAKRGEWGAALGQSLRTAEARVVDQQRQIQDLDAEVAKRGRWGLVLDQSLREAEARILDQQRQIQDLDAEVAKRGEWGAALGQSLRTAEMSVLELQNRVNQHATRETRLEENFRNLEEQMAEGQSFIANLVSHVGDLTHKAALLEEATEKDRREWARLSEEEHALRVKLNDKVTRMQNSFSWLVTSPLRALRRLLIDRK